ncbi:MAG: hypothetical protein H7338_02075 [Candidatus Sericytochromatia bacterium]|nr:hypothetical protein [Candidatus Sericytochromatia bacterium]
MFRHVVAGLMLASLIACGVPMSHPSMAPVRLQPVRVANTPLQGAYMCIELRPTAAMQAKARELRMSLGFLDMTRAIPPRAPEAFHVTVAYFKTLSPGSAQKLAERYQHAAVPLKITGWGVAQQQAAYFTVQGLQDWKPTIQTIVPDTCVGDDPHVTFGVHPGKPKDVHGVPKPLQNHLVPMDVIGDVHLKQGDRIVW